MRYFPSISLAGGGGGDGVHAFPGAQSQNAGPVGRAIKATTRHREKHSQNLANQQRRPSSHF